MKLNLDACDRICGNKFFYLTFVVIAFFVVLFFSYNTSPLFGVEFNDSSVFKMMGHVLLNGGVPYVDYFDHKGPNLYLINAIGECISPNWGLFPLQVLWLSVSLILWYKICLLFVRFTYSFIIVLLTTIFFIYAYSYGNFLEEWSLLPCSITIYLSLSFLVNHSLEKHSYWRSLVYGLCFGFVFFIRPNDAVMICGGVMTGIFLYIVLKQKKYASAFINALMFFLGFVIMAAPWFAFFAYHHALKDFYFGLIGFNIQYGGGILNNLRYSAAVLEMIVNCILLIILVIASKKQRLLWILIPVCTYILFLFGRNNFCHYYMTVTPAIILLFITMLFCQDNKGLTIFAVVIFMLSGYPKLGLDRIKTLSKQIVTKTIGQEFAQKKESVKEIEKCLLSIPEDERDSIWNYNDAFSTVFYQSGIIAQNNIPPVLSYHKQKLTKDMQMRQDVMLARPKWLLKTNIPSKLLNKPMWISKSYEPWYLSPADSIFIENNYYIIGGSEKSNYQLLKRKDEK